jgi:NADH-quinone oxidoreductase subunit H
MFFLKILLEILFIVIPILLCVAYFTLIERKLLGAIQRRRGPNVIGVFGLLQPLADGFKFLVKEIVLPSNANKFVFLFSPVFTFIISLMGWAVIPFNKYSVLADIPLGLIYLFAVASLGVHGIIMSGWSSNSKYAFLGALRSASQMISYEICVGLILATIATIAGSYNLIEIITAQESVWFVFLVFPLGLIMFISMLAETNRHPFDLPEAEAELVSGYNVEYSGMTFALFSLAEYSNMLAASALMCNLFLGGFRSNASVSYKAYFFFGDFFFPLKLLIFVVLFVWMRAALPRYRYDQLMNLGWKTFLPLTLTYCMLIFSCLYTFKLYSV